VLCDTIAKEYIAVILSHMRPLIRYLNVPVLWYITVKLYSSSSNSSSWP